MRSLALVILLVGVCSLGVASCTPPPEPNASPSPSTPQTWDPEAWEPTVKITPKTFTEEERWNAREQRLKQIEPETGPIPEVDLIRWTQSYEDYSTTISQCLNDAGFHVTPGYRGPDLGDGIPEEQLPAYDLANYRCESQYTLDPRLVGDWSDEQIALIYDYFEQYYIPCMKAHDQPVTEAGKPSRETYVSTFFTTEKRWWPYPQAQVPEEVSKACPELPPDKALYGG